MYQAGSSVIEACLPSNCSRRKRKFSDSSYVCLEFAASVKKIDGRDVEMSLIHHIAVLALSWLNETIIENDVAQAI